MKKQEASSRRRWLNLYHEHEIQVAIFLLAFIIFFARRPDALLNPQFWAEDGAQWFQDAFNGHYSIGALFHIYNGYLALFPRLIALFSFLVSLVYVPLYFNICALIVQCLPLVYIFSKRVNFISMKIKLFITFVYLVLPFTAEIHGNVTNSQWFLAVLLFILIFIKDNKSKLMNIFEKIMIFIASCSGPFSIILTPIAVFDAYRTKKLNKRHLFLFAGALLQLIFLILNNNGREHAPIGFSVHNFFDILGGQVFGAGLYGYKSETFFISKFYYVLLIALLGMILMYIAFIKSKSIELRYFIAYASFVLLAALLSPNGAPPGSTWWQNLIILQSGGRYYFLFHLSIFLCLGWLLLNHNKGKFYIGMRIISGVIVLSSLFIGAPKDFVHYHYADLHYKHYISQFNHLKPGQKIAIPLNPGGWSMTLIKR